MAISSLPDKNIQRTFPMLIAKSGGKTMQISGADFIESALMAGGGWRLVLGGSFILFFIATSIPGRLDMKLGKPKKEDMRFFTPSPWAFAIWGPIFLGEMAMAITTAVAPGALSGPAGDRWLMEMAPSYAAAALHQVLWTGAFREWALDKLWISASLLTFAAVGLFSAHGTITRALSIPDHVSTWGYIAAALPVSMHFGWMTCAAALSWNNVLNKFGAPTKVQLSAAIATCYGAAALLGHVSFWGKDPVPALVGAWALWAVSTGHEVLRGAVDNLSLDTLNFTAKCTSVMSALAAVATMVRRFAL